MTTPLSRAEAIARREADATGRPHVVLNLNWAGAPLYVCRELRDGIEADRIVSRFDPAPSAPVVEPVASVVGEAPARARYAPVYNPAGTGGYDIVDRDTGSADINGARHWFGDFHFAQKACDALNAGRPCPTMAEMCEAVPAGPVYHPLTVRALRIYQNAAKARFTRIPDADADEDYTSGAEWAASEGLRDPVDRLRAYTRERCGELLAKARAIRAKMRCGNWQGDNNPLDLATVQEALLQRREDRRALVAAKSRAIAPAPAMVPQPVQQQQARARGRAQQPARGERRYVTVRDTETGDVHRVLTSVARVGVAVVIFVPSNRHRQGALGGMLITHDDIRKAWVFNDEAEARRFLSGNRAPGERVIRAELVADPAPADVPRMAPQPCQQQQANAGGCRVTIRDDTCRAEWSGSGSLATSAFRMALNKAPRAGLTTMATAAFNAAWEHHRNGQGTSAASRGDITVIIEAAR